MKLVTQVVTMPPCDQEHIVLDIVACCHTVHCLAATHWTSLVAASPNRTSEAVPGENLAKFRIGGDTTRRKIDGVSYA